LLKPANYQMQKKINISIVSSKTEQNFVSNFKEIF
jgi:hypothetical protein